MTESESNFIERMPFRPYKRFRAQLLEIAEHRPSSKRGPLRVVPRRRN
jgi:hypothetical protein